MIKLMILEQGEYPGLFRSSQCNHWGFYKREARGSKLEKRRCDVGIMEFEDGGRGHDSRDVDL